MVGMPDLLFRLPPQFDGMHRIILAALIRHLFKADDFECWPSLQTLAECTGLNTRTVGRKLVDLRELGVIDWRHKSIGKRGHINAYRILDGLKKLAPATNPRKDSQSTRDGTDGLPTRDGWTNEAGRMDRESEDTTHKRCTHKNDLKRARTRETENRQQQRKTEHNPYDSLGITYNHTTGIVTNADGSPID